MVGLWGKPTVVNNVETLVFAAAIAAKGSGWFRSYGVNTSNGVKSRGLKFVGISGDVQSPGVFEVPMGTTYEDLIYKYAKGLPPGRELVAFAPSGPSSGFLPQSKVTLPLDWETLKKETSMVGSGAIVVCGTGTCMLDMALNAVRFYRNESCGKCVPCRSGSKELVEMLERWTRGMYQERDVGVVQDLSYALRRTSICGLGQILPAPIESVFRHFRAEVDEHILHRRCPAGVCFREEEAVTQTTAGLSSMVQLEIDGQTIGVPQGMTILEAARKLNIEIPAPCHQEGASPGECRVCIVELAQRRHGKDVYKNRLYATACTRKMDQSQDQNLIILTNTAALQATRRTLLELLMAEHPAPCLRQRESGDCELERLADQFGLTRPS
jgi:ferredoxin